MKVLGVGRYRRLDNEWVWCERVENPNIWDEHHTVRLIADKRAFVHAVRKTAALSDAFTQDLEDYVDAEIVADLIHPPKEPARASEAKANNKPPDSKAKEQPKAEGKPEAARGNLIAGVESVEEAKSSKDKPFLRIKLSGVDGSFTLWDTAQFENMRTLKGRQIAVDYQEKVAGDKTYRNIVDFWLQQQP